jgi:hypothetical protein
MFLLRMRAAGIGPLRHFAATQQTVASGTVAERARNVETALNGSGAGPAAMRALR